MLTARSLQKVFAPPHPGLGCVVSPASWLPTIRSCHSGNAGDGAHSFPPASAAVRVRTAEAAAPRAVESWAAMRAVTTTGAAWSSAVAAARRSVIRAAATVADARASVTSARELRERAKRWVDEAAKDVDDARAAAALHPQDAHLAAAVGTCEALLKKEEASLTGRGAVLKGREAHLKDHEQWLQTQEAWLVRARATQRSFKSLPTEFPRVAPDVALQQLGALARSKRFEVPTHVPEDVERHVCTLRHVIGQPLDESAIPNLAVAATPGAGKTTLLRYLQQTADTVRYGAELQSDTNWLAKSWSAPHSAVRRSLVVPTKSVPTLRQVFVGYATFKQGSDTSFDPSIDTKATIQRRCAWRILHDAGLAAERTPNFGLNIIDAAEALRAKISIAKGCTADEVAIVFLIDDVTNVSEGPRRELLRWISVWQQTDLAARRLSFSVVAGLSLFGVGEQSRGGSRPTAALRLQPLVELPRELAAEVTKDARLDRSRKLELLGYIGAAGGHPGTLERTVDAMTDPQNKKIQLPAPQDVEELACVWDVLVSADSANTGDSVDAHALATASEYELHRRLLDRNCLQQHPETCCIPLSPIVLSATPSGLFLAEDLVWAQQRSSGAALPSCDAAAAVRALMQATDGIAEKWGPAFAGALHLTAQGVMHARLKLPAIPWRTEQGLERRGLVSFKKLVPGAIIGCQCADLRYVVRDEFAHTVDRALARADFQKLRDASYLHSQAPDQTAIEDVFAAECGGEAVVVAAQQKFGCDASEHQVDEWFDAAAEFMRGHTEGDKFRVLLCVTGLSDEALEGVKKRAANKDDRLSRSIIIDPASASQLFERFGLWTFLEALRGC